MKTILEETEALTSLPLENTLAQVRERIEQQFAIENLLSTEALERFSNGFNELFQKMQSAITPFEKLDILARTIKFLKTFQEHHQAYLSHDDKEEFQRAMLIFLGYSKLFKGNQLLLQGLNVNEGEINFQVILNAVELMAQALNETPVYFSESTYQAIRQVADNITPHLTINSSIELSDVDEKLMEYQNISLQRKTQRSLSSMLLAVQQWEEATGKRNPSRRFRRDSGSSFLKHADTWVGDNLEDSSWELVIGKEPLEELLKKSQASIHRLDELNPKTEEEAKEQIETFDYLKQQFGWD